MNQSSSDTVRTVTTERKIFVRLAMAAAGLVFVLTAGILYYRWASTVEPTTMVVVIGDESLRGVEVIVEGLGITQPYHAVFGERERFILPFYLDPGSYTVRVLRGDRVLFEKNVVVQKHLGRQIDLTKLNLPPTTASTTTQP
jgi:hypothetical protein